jgi:hypothetical protein
MFNGNALTFPKPVSLAETERISVCARAIPAGNHQRHAKRYAADVLGLTTPPFLLRRWQNPAFGCHQPISTDLAASSSRLDSAR